MNTIPVFAPCLGLDTMKHLTDALDVGWLGMGKTTKQFEDDLSSYFNLSLITTLKIISFRFTRVFIF